MHRNLLAILIILAATLGTSLGASAETIRITSYNTGFLERNGVDFVPCIAERLKPQVAAVLGPSIAPAKEKFAILLQEVWTWAAFETYRRTALARGLFVTPSKYSDVQQNGQMIITNMKVLAARFEPFKSESYGGRGIRSIEVQTSRGQLVIANVHTSYSSRLEFLPAHREQIKQINQYFWSFTHRASLIVGGDFNAGRKMGFHGGTYDARNLIWDQVLEPAFSQLGMRVSGNPDAVTWDEENNRLVSDPTRVIRWMNYYDHGTTGWDATSSRFDNIFASYNLAETQTGRTMLQKVKLAATCTGHADRDGRMHLSDHYGIFSIFSL